MRKFENILSQIAKSEGVQPNEVLIEMQQAIQEAYNHRDESNQAMWDMLSENGKCPTPEEFILRSAMLLEKGNGRLN